MNLGQLSLLLRAKYLVDVQSHTQVTGLPFRAAVGAAGRAWVEQRWSWDTIGASFAALLDPDGAGSA
ncbi:hypothetical protein GCM10023162_32890 [Klenkia terrae]